MVSASSFVSAAYASCSIDDCPSACAAASKFCAAFVASFLATAMAVDSAKLSASAALSACSCKLWAKSSLGQAWVAASLACCAIAAAASAKEAFIVLQAADQRSLHLTEQP